MLHTLQRRFRHNANGLEDVDRTIQPTSPQHTRRESSDRIFLYKPLDETQSAIRLVTFTSELSSDGCVQCYLSHSTLERASYVCLSYRWGPPGPLKRILINGLPFYIRSNLYDFLDMARKMPMTFYWIDAICIDQSNTLERNHQVAHMGRIFSRAFLVYVWLGKEQAMAPWMQHGDSSKAQDHLRLRPRTNQERRDIIKNCIFNNEYWCRAWVCWPISDTGGIMSNTSLQITHEILLAREVLILVSRDSFKLTELSHSLRTLESADRIRFRNCAFAPVADIIDNRDKLHLKTLVNLLDRFRHKECDIPRDRIFSLLSLCTNFQLPEINYAQSSEDLAYDVLHRADEPLCICSALLISHTLCLTDSHVGEMEQPSETFSTIEFDIKDLRYTRHAMLCNDQIHSWAHYKLIGTDIFGHDQILSDLCPALEAFMDSLQNCALNMKTHPSLSQEHISTESELEPEPLPSLLRMMDEEHSSAIIHGFGPELSIQSHIADQNTSTVRVAFWLLAKLLPQDVPLCRKVAQGSVKRERDDVLFAPVENGKSVEEETGVMRFRLKRVDVDTLR